MMETITTSSFDIIIDKVFNGRNDVFCEGDAVASHAARSRKETRASLAAVRPKLDRSLST
jgi:hypothetical protein